MPVILETISWILKNVNVGVDRLIVGYGVRFVYSVGLIDLPKSGGAMAHPGTTPLQYFYAPAFS